MDTDGQLISPSVLSPWWTALDNFKIKVLPINMIKHHAIKTYKEVEIHIHLIFGNWVGSRTSFEATDIVTCRLVVK
jgi:hypothetical protein